MDVFLMWVAIEIGKVLCYPNTCATEIIQEISAPAEEKKPEEPKPVVTEEPVEEKNDE